MENRYLFLLRSEPPTVIFLDFLMFLTVKITSNFNYLEARDRPRWGDGCFHAGRSLRTGLRAVSSGLVGLASSGVTFWREKFFLTVRVISCIVHLVPPAMDGYYPFLEAEMNLFEFLTCDPIDPAYLMKEAKSFISKLELVDDRELRLHADSALEFFKLSVKYLDSFSSSEIQGDLVRAYDFFKAGKNEMRFVGSFE